MNQGRSDSSDCRSAGTVGAMLRCFRERRLWTQAVLAERAGLPEKTISSLETGARRRPHLTTLEMLADALELDGADRDALRGVRDGRVSIAPAVAATVPLLPLPATSFVGRAEPERQVAELLDRPEVRLLTLTGTGGIGKTRLALHVAEMVASRFDDGAVFVECAAVRDPALIPGTIAHAVQLHVPGGQPVEAALNDYFASRELLLILDNVEQVLEAAIFFDRLVAGSPGLVMLVTSRERLALAREHVYVVGAMTVPDLESEPDIETVARSEAVQLFVQRASVAQISFTLTPANAADVAAICAGLDGIPLAIELAAARLAHVGAPAVLRERLDRRLAWLKSGLRDQAARHRTMRDAIAWSYETLEPDDQWMFRRLAVFAGGFTVDAAEAVSRQTEEGSRQNDEQPSDCRLPTADSVLDGIASLVDKNLVQLYDSRDGGTRYRMLETIREYAVEQLIAQGDEFEARRRHALTFVELVKKAEPLLDSAESLRWLDHLEEEYDNLWAAFAWLLEHDDAESALQLTSSLWQYWWLRGRLRAGRDWIVRALANPRGASGKMIALAQIILGNINSDLGDYPAARAAYEASIATSRDIGDTPWVAKAMHNLGIVTGYQGDYERARELIEESLALDVNTPNPERRHGLALSMLGDLAYCEGDYVRSRELLEQNLDISRRLENETSVAYDSYFLGRTLWQFDRAAARALIEQSLDHFRSTGDKLGTAYSAIELGRQAIEDSDLDRARALYVEAASLWRELGGAHVAVMCIEGFALLAVAADAWREAARLLGAATSGRSALGRPRPANERVSLDEAATRVRSALDDADWEQRAERGARMRIEELVGEFLRNS